MHQGTLQLFYERRRFECSGRRLFHRPCEGPSKSLYRKNQFRAQKFVSFIQVKPYCQKYSPLRNLKHLNLEILWSTDLDSNVEEYH
ncbi:uncharacterized protein Bfra_004132 [Botrytis fragariae]|uniref:Uncharacterized protein n=1 Tax=Botrytis fragariae TaxID=1964551 RepID=A0A8H6EJG1_9HELO|nr:uncharacterized protein Bfra_004132 [Botrytis fragariae]KAF5874125.1 hypothetical protein Bfra_004132 [Botrytis fragariae]